jgi:type I restriction enzyme S subunit
MKLPAYRKYKPSDIHWLGDLPATWDLKRLKFAARIEMGQSPSSTEYASNSDERPFLQGNGEFGDRHPIARLFCDSAPKVAPPSAILLSVRAPVGELNEADQPYGIGRGLCAVMPKPARLDNHYAWYLLAVTRTDLVSRETGSTYGAVSVDEVGDMAVCLPTTTEQRAIADFLDQETARLDTLVRKKRELIETLKEKRTTLISRTVTRGLPPEAARAAGLNPQAKLKSSGIEWLGDIPEHWVVKLLKRIAKINYGVGGEIDRSLESGLKTISLPNIDIEGRLNVDDVPYADVSEAEKRDLLLRKGDLLFNWRNGSSDHLGKTAYFNEDGEFSHVSFLLRLRFDPRKNDSRFFQHLLGGYRTTRFFSHSKAGVNNTFNLSELAALPVICPPTPEQRAIADFLDSETVKLDRMMEKVEAAIEKLQEYRTAIITAAVTGKIDVRAVRK